MDDPDELARISFLDREIKRWRVWGYRIERSVSAPGFRIIRLCPLAQVVHSGTASQNCSYGDTPSRTHD
jgi:hypothetical protein